MSADVEPALHGGPGGPALPPVESPQRLRSLRVVLITALAVLVAGLAYRQIGAKAAEASARERRQSMRRVLDEAPRGALFDRRHQLLVGNREHTAAVLPL